MLSQLFVSADGIKTKWREKPSFSFGPTFTAVDALRGEIWCFSAWVCFPPQYASIHRDPQTVQEELTKIIRT